MIRIHFSNDAELRFGKYKLDRYLPKRFFQHRIAPLFNSRLFVENQPPRWIICVNNYCNLRCFSCSNLCDRPFDPRNVYRDRPRKTSLEDFERFLVLTQDWHPEWPLRYKGGEPTMDPDHLNKMLSLAKEYGRYNDLLTNGFQFLKIDPFLCDKIMLDDHGPLNRQLIDKCAEYLEEVKHPNWWRKITDLHYDLDGAREVVWNEFSEGPRLCKNFMVSITLWEKTLYPCCVLNALEGFDNNPRIGESLREAGWTVDNDDLVKVLEGFRKTLPGEALRTCLFRCWRGGYGKTSRKLVEEVRL